MKDILYMMILGLAGGMLAGFWTRVIEPDMLLSFVTKWMYNLDYKHMLKTGRGDFHPLVKFLNCVFCITPWFTFLFCTWYIIEYTPSFITCVIGVLGALGAGNFVAEGIYATRNHE